MLLFEQNRILYFRFRQTPNLAVNAAYGQLKEFVDSTTKVSAHPVIFSPNFFILYSLPCSSFFALVDFDTMVKLRTAITAAINKLIEKENKRIYWLFGCESVKVFVRILLYYKSLGVGTSNTAGVQLCVWVWVNISVSASFKNNCWYE